MIRRKHHEASAGVDESSTLMRGSADASVADLTRYLARSVGDVPSRFRRSRTFGLFVLLATGLVAQTARRTVVGMLVGAGVAAVVSFHACCRFFSHHRWDVDRIGLVLARLIVDRLLDAGAPIVVVVDDTLFRWGKVFGAFWTHDGSGQDPNARPWQPVGDRRDPRAAAVLRASGVLAGAVATLARQGHRVPVQLARELILLLAQEFPDRCIHAVGDAAYHGKALLVERTTVTTRGLANAALRTAPPGTGRRGRPG